MKIIDSITIRYFRSVYTLNIGQCEDITIVSGRNDVGKSNILKALNLFFCQQSDYLHNFDFVEDYSNIRRDEVKKDTIRGQQFISISIRFLRGNRMENSLPPSFSVTKRWDMHSSECKMTSDVLARMEQFSKKHGKKFSEKTTNTSLSTFLNRIRYIYVPAIKDEQVFKETLNLLQESLFSSKNKKILDTPINEANHAVQNVIGELQKDFEDATGIKNFVELPNTLNYTHGLLQVNTQTSNTVLLKFLHSLRDNVQSNQVIIGMFDRDTPLLTEINGSRVDIRNEKFVKIGKNIFAFSIPVPHARAESNQISIEHYFTDEEIKTELEGKRLFIGNEFYKTGVCKSNPSLYYKSGARVADTIKIIEHESNNYVMNADGTGDYSISKSAFVNAICEEKDSFKGFSFDEFQKIFDVINSIVSSSKE